jgi:hypothetical protein
VLAPGLDTDAQADRILAAISPWSSDGLLPNFATSDDPRQIRRCYDSDTLHRLQTLGDQYDPGRVLQVGQVVRTPAAAAEK